ncbi:MAG: hypothetical protein B6D38_05600 [Anaerolineae bacterium UTCFX1]|jgi:hypothetical protein|nr:MAG: hypothetical protein B6D38_05600 [Anaerolineae bacterium UTCFX1]
MTLHIFPLLRPKRGALVAALLSFSLFGCVPATPAATTVSTPFEATAASPTSTTLPTPASEYDKQIRNAQYQLGMTDSPRVVQLVDGRYSEGAPGDADLITINMMDFIARGDLNGDGMDEVAVVVAENYGGSGVFVFIATYSLINDEPVFQTSTFVDDRPAINALTIEDGEVFLDAVTHAAEDPFCCPTLHNQRHYQLVNNQLIMSDYVTFTPGGSPRTITIESPANGAEAFSSVLVKGNFAIAPFENTFAYRIYDMGGVELSAGSFTVTSADFGAPGAFETMINIGGLLSGSAIRVEIQDINAQDGSWFAMDSVALLVK